MGNQTPQSHNQSLDRTLKDETDFEVHSVVKDLIEAVHKISEMTSTKEGVQELSNDEPAFPLEEDQALDQTTYYDCDKELDLISPMDSLCIDVSHNENDYSSGRSSGSTSVSDWKYTPNYDYESIGSKYNAILDSWTQPKDDQKPVKPPRASIIRRFDPLVSTSFEHKSPPNSSYLADDNRNTLSSSESPIDSTLGNPKPDLVYIAEQNDKNFEEEINQLKDEMNSKDRIIKETKDALKMLKNNESKLISLVNTLHLINEELVITAHEAVTQRTECPNDSQLQLKCDRLGKENHELRSKCVSIEEELRRRGNENESITLKVQIKRLQMKLNTTLSELESKTKENTELSAMVDELISKVRL